MTVPMSSTTVSRSSAASPVSGSISTSQMWQPLGKVGTSGEKPPAPCNPTPSSDGKPTGMNDICATWPIGIERSVPDGKGAVGKGDLGGVGLYETRREALVARDDLVGCGAQGAPADHHAARGIGAAADRDLVGVGLRQMDLVLGHAEPVGDHLRMVVSGNARREILTRKQTAGLRAVNARWALGKW
jgi:hypothetical protein